MGVRRFPLESIERDAPIEALRFFPLAPPQGVLVSYVGTGGVACGGAAVVIFKVPIEVSVHVPSVTGGPPVSRQVKVAEARSRVAGRCELVAGGYALVLPFYRPRKRVVRGYGGFVVGARAVVTSFDRFKEQRFTEEEELLLFWVA